MYMNCISLFIFVCVLLNLFGTTFSSIENSPTQSSSFNQSTNLVHQEFWLDIGTNITLFCNLSSVHTPNFNDTQWIRDGKHEDRSTEYIVHGHFVIVNVTKDNEGNYTCTSSEDDVVVYAKYTLHVRQTPGPVENVRVRTRSVMAYIMWSPGKSRGYDVSSYTVQFKLKYGAWPDHWKPVHPNRELKPSSTFVEIYLLEPNTTYVFRIWANNKLGAGEIVEVEALTKHDNTEIQLARHLLIGMEDFDTRIWLGAVAFVMGTLLVLAVAILWLFWREFRATRLRKPRLRRVDLLKRKRNTANTAVLNEEASEVIELIPNIILNPAFEEDTAAGGGGGANKPVTSYIGTRDFLYSS